MSLLTEFNGHKYQLSLLTLSLMDTSSCEFSDFEFKGLWTQVRKISLRNVRQMAQRTDPLLLCTDLFYERHIDVIFLLVIKNNQ